MTAVASAASELRRRLPAERVVDDPDVLSAMSADQSAWSAVGRAAAGVRPRSSAEVADVVRVCAQLRIPLVPRGAGTGLSGGANALDGCVVLDLSTLDRVLAVNAGDMTVVVQPGVVNNDLKATLASHGLWYPPDPASAASSTIGGNVATNAGGLCCVKYGVTRDYVLGLEAVVGGPVDYGTAVRVGRRTAKGVAGYDLVGLFVGSEGTLGVITEVTLRVRAARGARPRTVVGFFSSLVAAGDAVAKVTAAGIVPAALELLDRACLQAVEDWKHFGLDADAEVLLLAHVDLPGAAGDDEAARLVDCFAAAGATWTAASTDDAEAEALFETRRLVHPAMERRGAVLSEDICVPRSAVPAMLAAIERIGAAHELPIATIAHAGDGNLHPLLVTPRGDSAAAAAAQQAFEEILDAAIELGGTITGEHGVGLLKRAGLRREQSADVLAIQHALKAAFDPLNIFNPGKVLG
ncbi:MAG: FAD-binding oxidoreductase [Mycobacteriales bacterium]|nr:MAG: FAD-binding oxidoreductase [Pseudonocardiales bacterium]